MAKARKSKSRSLVSGTKRLTEPAVAGRLLDDVRRLIDGTKQQVARTVNSAMVALYWQIGKRIREDILHEKRAEYGEEIVSSLSTQLTAEYGRGFSRRNLFRMVRFAEVFPDEQIVSSLMTQLSWTHLIYIIPLDDPLKRDFYAEMCRLERWSVRTLRKKVDGMLFERTALSKKPDQFPRTGPRYCPRMNFNASCTKRSALQERTSLDRRALESIGVRPGLGISGKGLVPFLPAQRPFVGPAKIGAVGP